MPKNRVLAQKQGFGSKPQQDVLRKNDTFCLNHATHCHEHALNCVCVCVCVRESKSVTFVTKCVCVCVRESVCANREVGVHSACRITEDALSEKEAHSFAMCTDALYTRTFVSIRTPMVLCK